MGCPKGENEIHVHVEATGTLSLLTVTSTSLCDGRRPSGSVTTRRESYVTPVTVLRLPRGGSDTRLERPFVSTNPKNLLRQRSTVYFFLSQWIKTHITYKYYMVRNRKDISIVPVPSVLRMGFSEVSDPRPITNVRSFGHEWVYHFWHSNVHRHTVVPFPQAPSGLQFGTRNRYPTIKPRPL